MDKGKKLQEELANIITELSSLLDIFEAIEHIISKLQKFIKKISQ